MNYHRELSEALFAAKTSGDIQLKFQQQKLSVQRKFDRSPVTEVDQQCEALIRDHLLKIFPSDGFLGEETGEYNGKSSRTWIVDPLDGTRPFIRGIPTHSTLIALEDEGVPVVGVIHLPSMGITCWGSRGDGAFKNGSPIHVSSTELLTEVTGSALGFLGERNDGLEKKLISLMKSWDYNYGFMDAFSYVCVADGRLDCAVNLLDKAWDCASAACIISEAGGSYCDIEGNKSVHNGSIILSNKILEPEILEFFK